MAKLSVQQRAQQDPSVGGVPEMTEGLGVF